MKKLMIILSVLLHSVSYGDTCSNIFVDNDLFLKKLRSFEVEVEGELKNLLVSIPRRRQAMILDSVDSFGEENLKKAIQVYKESPEVFKRIDEFDELRFLNEVAEPGYARSSFSRQAGSTNEYTWKMPEFVDSNQVKALDKKYRKAMIEIRNFLDDEAQVFKRMQEFEDDILARSRLEFPKFDELPAEKQAMIKQNNMENVLAEYEELHGFKSAVKGEYKVSELENRSYSMQEWFDMLKEGRQFNDTTFKQAENAAAINEGLRNSHGYYTHRIQWHILMKEMDSAPARFENFQGAQLFKKFGDDKFGKKLGLNNDGGNTLWQHIFDSFSSTYHSPEYFRRMHTLYPGIGSWL